MHTLVTGVTGFIGSHVAAALLDDGHRVTGVSRQTDPDVPFTTHEGFEIVTADLRTDTLGTTLPECVDIVYHYAAQLPDEIPFQEYLSGNVMTTYNIFTYATDAASMFVQASTGSVYGWQSEPMIIDGQTPEQPHSEYGLTKYLADTVVRSQAPHTEVAACILRYSIVHEDGTTEGLVGDLFRAAQNDETITLKEGTANRKIDCIHIKDVVTANLALLDQDPDSLDGELLLVGSGESLQIKEIARRIIRRTDSKSEIEITDDDESPPDVHWDVSRTIDKLHLESLDAHSL